MANTMEPQKKTDLKVTMNDTISQTREQLSRLSSNIQDFLSSINANVETSKFLIEKVDDGTRIDIEFRAIIGMEKTKMSDQEMTHPGVPQ